MKLTFEKFKRFFPPVILAIIIATVVNIYLYNTEMTRNKENLDYAHRTFAELKWNLVEAILVEEHRAAGIQSKMIAERIESNLRKEYPNIQDLRQEIDRDGFINGADNKFNRVLKDSITSMYLYNLRNDNNDPFIANSDGIIMDLSLSQAPVLGEKRTWMNEVNHQANKKLASSTYKLLIDKSDKILFIEHDKSFNPDHVMIEEPRMELLKQEFEREGLQGLQTYQFFSPAYITDTGDIFGIDDIGVNGRRNVNHKIVVVQEFNLYEQIVNKHMHRYQKIEEIEKAAYERVHDSIRFRTIVTVFTTILNLFIIVFLMAMNNKVFHDTEWCPCKKGQKKEDEEKATV